MGCCGQRRNQFRNAAPPSGIRATTPPATSGIDRASGASAAVHGSRIVTLRYLGPKRVLVRGPATGRQYDVSAAAPMVAVDSRDVDGLLRTRQFVRAP
jgi:hypothetical protein